MAYDYGTHECLHMAAFFAGAVDDELCEHEKIKSNPAWLILAEHAVDTLAKLYQLIGTEMCKDCD